MRRNAALLLVVLLVLGSRKSSAGAGELPMPARRNVAQAQGWLSFDQIVALAESVGFTPSARQGAAEGVEQEAVTAVPAPSAHARETCYKAPNDIR